MATEAALYRATDAREKLARRTTKYQFDLERDIAWDAPEGDHFFPTELLRDMGMNVDRLDGHPEARAALEWALALGACKNFIDLEEVVVRFVDEANQGGELAGERSLGLLQEEEKKHIALFQRVAARLAARRPAWTAAFEEAYRATAEFNGKQRLVHFQRELYPDEAARHFVFWVAIVFFEEFTIYLDERLSADPGVDALWRSAHAAHRREEVQHVATDIAFADALALSDDDRAPWSDVFVTGIVRDLRFMTGIDAPAAFVAKLFPEVGNILQETAPTDAPFLREICQRPEFKRTRAYLPTLALFA